MKKGLFFAFSVLVLIGVIACSFLLGDRTAPEIRIISTPRLDENCGIDNLLDYAEAHDENLKSFTIEDTSILQIIENKHITYVAIDESNNVSKAKVDVEIDPKYTNCNIVCIHKPTIQVNDKFDVNDYFVLQNEYGVNIEDKLIVGKVDTSKVGEYTISIKSSSNLCNPLETTITVINKNAPRITLTKDTIEYYVDTYWSDYDFTNIIDTLEDDVDSYDYLLENISIDWQYALKAQSNGYVSIPGTYEVTYTVTDSDGNETKTTVKVILDKPIVEEAVEVISEE